MSRRVVEYQLVEKTELHLLVNAINFWIERGWEPQGGVAMTESGYYAQAIVRYEA